MKLDRFSYGLIVFIVFCLVILFMLQTYSSFTKKLEEQFYLN